MIPIIDPEPNLELYLSQLGDKELAYRVTEFIRNYCAYWSPFGSTFILGEGQDLDVVVLTAGMGYYIPFPPSLSGEYSGYPDAVEFFREGRLNLIVCYTPEEYWLRVGAARAARWLCVNDALDPATREVMKVKDQRIKLHRAVLGEG